MSIIEFCLAIIAWKMVFPSNPYEDNYEGEADYLSRMDEKRKKKQEFWDKIDKRISDCFKYPFRR